MIQITRMTKSEWMAKGMQLFGDDVMQWRFVCPACGHIQCPTDFEPYSSKGATPSSATCTCIGRYDGHINIPMWAGQQPCNYAGYGLLNICPVVVIDDGTEIRSFAFAPGLEEQSNE